MYKCTVLCDRTFSILPQNKNVIVEGSAESCSVKTQECFKIT